MIVPLKHPVYTDSAKFNADGPSIADYVLITFLIAEDSETIVLTAGESG